MKFILLAILLTAAYYVIVKPLVQALLGVPDTQERIERKRDLEYTDYEEVQDEDH